MFDNVTPETAQRIVQGVKGYLSNANIDNILKNPQQTARNVSLFGFHPSAPNHVRDLAYEVEIVRQKRAETITRLEQIPSEEPAISSLGLKRPSKKITLTNVQLVVDAIESGAPYAQIDTALDRLPANGIRKLAVEGKHPNASAPLKRISEAVANRIEKKSTTQKLLAAVV